MITIDRPKVAVTVRAEKRGDADIWVELCFELREPDGLRWFAHAGEFQSHIEGTDELAKSYDLEDWESGIQSGFFFIARKANRMPPPPVRIFEVSGRLGGEDMVGLARAAEAGFAALLNFNWSSPQTEWTIVIAR